MMSLSFDIKLFRLDKKTSDRLCKPRHSYVVSGLDPMTLQCFLYDRAASEFLPVVFLRAYGLGGLVMGTGSLT